MEKTVGEEAVARTQPPAFPWQCPPRFDIEVKDLFDYTEKLITFLQHEIHGLRVKLSNKAWTFDIVVLPLAHIDNHIKGNAYWIALFQSVSPDESLRKASSQCAVQVDKLHSSLFQDADIFRATDAVYQARNEQSPSLDPESRRLLDSYHKSFQENGLTLATEQRHHFKTLSARVVELRTAFFENLASSPPSIVKDISELHGLSEQALSTLKDDGVSSSSRSIVLNRPSVTRVLTECANEETRREVYLADHYKYPENASLFREIVLLRDEIARLLGFRSFADQHIKDKLVGSPESALELLQGLEQSLQSTTQNNIEMLSKMKGGRIHLWDFDYYHNILLKDKYQVDHLAISEYFPAEYTLRIMLDVFEQLFGLKINKMETKDMANVWHPDVELFMVSDTTDHDAEIGYLYFDLYPRPGKYNHAANFSIRPSYIDEVGHRILPATALVCNVTYPDKGKPALLLHREVLSIFHELGHAIHDLLGQSTYALFHGHQVVKDFVEAPSQLLEYWCWTAESLQRLSCHYSYLSADFEEQYLRSHITSSSTPAMQPPLRLPEAMIAALVASRGVDSGILTARQLAFSLFDLRIYHPKSRDELISLDFNTTFNSLFEDKTLLKGPGGYDYGHPYATSSHWIWGQESSYYSYLYTRILAADMWHTNFRSSPMDKIAGLKYREMILSRGGNQDVMENLTKFLGRKPNLDAYFLHDLMIRRS